MDQSINQIINSAVLVYLSKKQDCIIWSEGQAAIVLTDIVIDMIQDYWKLEFLHHHFFLKKNIKIMVM